MAKYTGPVCRMCRREGEKLFLKGARCLSGKCSLEKRPTPPGQHAATRKKASEYSIQLREKQKTRRFYGLCEKQFKGYFNKASKMRGATGENMLVLLERRLDNVVYRMGLASSRAQARQIVNHGLITVNGKRVDIPSFKVKAGDVVALSEKSKKSPKFAQIAEATNGRLIPVWLDMNKEESKAVVTRLPQRDELDFEIEEQLVIELYSK